MPPKSLPGFRDFYPEQFAEREFIFKTWRRVVRRYAFVEYDAPPLETLELYTSKSGEEIVTQLYNFVDKGERAVAMRPEMTPSFARMVGAKAQSMRKPIRWFSIPQLFRYERMQKGRLREHFQLNVDLVGESEALADAELLSVALEIMREFGLSAEDICARVSDRRLLNAMLNHLAVPEAAWASVYAVLDKIERQPKDVSRERLSAAGVSESSVDAIMGFSGLAFSDVVAQYGDSQLVGEQVREFTAYLDSLAALGIGEFIRFDLTIVRGLAYYTGIVFELFDLHGEFRAICGGGRYDKLLSTLGGVDLPALGFGMGDVVLGELLRARELMPQDLNNVADVWLAQPDSDDSYPAITLKLATRLRSRGLAVEYPLRRQRVDKQFDAARKAGARNFVLIERDSTSPDAQYRFRLRDGSHSDLQFASVDALTEHLIMKQDNS